MNIFREHNAGKLSELRGQRDRLQGKSHLKSDEEEELRKIEYKIGRYENKEKQFEEKHSCKLAKLSRNKTDNSSHHTEIAANTTITKNKQIGVVGNSVSVKKPKSTKCKK